MSNSFREKPLSERKSQWQKLVNLYPAKIPIIVEKATNLNTPDIDKSKFLVSMDTTVGQFQHQLRNMMKGLQPEQAIFLFVNQSIPTSTESIQSVYCRHKNEDGFLYITYSTENTFGKAMHMIY